MKLLTEADLIHLEEEIAEAERDVINRDDRLDLIYDQLE